MLKVSSGLCLLLWLAHAHCAGAEGFRRPVLHRRATHTPAAGTVAYGNAEKNIFASGGEDATINLYEATDGREIRTLRGHEKQVYQVTFSPDGEMQASAGEEGTRDLRQRSLQTPRVFYRREPV